MSPGYNDAILKQMFEDRIPFNQLLGAKIEMTGKDAPRIRIDMRDELIGNFVRGTLHGGVISAIIDVSGGLAAMLDVLNQMHDHSVEEKLKRFGRVGTIDLRVDYLRPGTGRYFIATSNILRTGRRVAVTRTEFHNDEDTLIAVGTGAYVVS